mmetsp:Transcript_68267/g.134936  ORF Transcript_68267/g.134936 Transcript_68267/m.134936 type:complete len:255 (-) Transcript_68267:175-939(-)
MAMNSTRVGPSSSGITIGSVQHGTSVASEISPPRKAVTPLPVVVPPSRKSAEFRFDLLRLREWFNRMDVEQCGYVTKGSFMNFLRNQPQLQALLVDGQAPQQNFRRTGLQEDAVRWRRQSSTWEDFSCGQAHMEWHQFVDFFRRRGWVLDYKTKDNPRDRLAEMLADLHTRPFEPDRQTLHEFAELRRGHLQGQQKRQLGIAIGLDKPCAFEAACLAIAKPPASRCSTTIPSIRSSSRQSASVPCGARFRQGGC